MKQRFQPSKLVLWLSILTLVAACGGGGGGVVDRTPTPPAPPAPPPSVPAPPQIKLDGFVTVSDATWDDTAVRKVLHAFAFGGHAMDSQIATWADMDPSVAIMQMLTFAEHNELLSPPSPHDQDGLPARSGKLHDLAVFWASDDPANGVPPDRRTEFDYSVGGGWIERLWPMATTMRGLNPFRQRIAYWEANHHLAVNLSAGIGTRSLIRYYDDIAESLENGDSYDKVLATAASSAAIAEQYGHWGNRMLNGECVCNEDFAREFYQLFFGILGGDDAQRHETVTIKNTAKALTGMVVGRDNSTPNGEIVYSPDHHYSDTLEILGQSVDGTNARERISAIAALAINHSESLANLPIMIVRGLADDNLDETKISNIRRAWADMSEKDLLLFVRAYAISDIFHSDQRVKYLTTLERRLLIATKLISVNNEIYQNVYSVIGHMLEGIKTFRPVDNVFGGQTGDMASSSAEVFRVNFNQSTENNWRYRRSSLDENGFRWTKDWRQQIPAADAEEITVAAATEWLWNHFIADSGKNLGPLERAHLYALIASGQDLAYLIDPTNPEAIYTANDVITNATIIALTDTLGAQMTKLHTNATERLQANEHLGQAVNFITATPFMLYQEGR